MSMSAFKYSIHLPFMPCAVSSEWVGSKFLATLDALTQVDSNIFPDWEVADLPAMKGYPLAAARSRIAEIIDNNVFRNDTGQPEPEGRYSAEARTTISVESRRMTLCIYTWFGSMWLDAGDRMVASDPAIVTYPLFRAALLAVNAIWQQPWACAQAFKVDYQKVPLYVGAALFPYSIFHIPWIVYLSAELAAGLKVPSDILSERMPDGGLLMITAEERLDPTNPEHLRRARILAETLIARAIPDGRKWRE